MFWANLGPMLTGPPRRHLNVKIMVKTQSQSFPDELMRLKTDNLSGSPSWFSKTSTFYLFLSFFHLYKF